MKSLLKSSLADGILLQLLLAFWVASAQEIGNVENFHATSNTKDSITLEWNVVEGEIEIEGFNLLVVEIAFETSIRCKAEHCATTVEYLDPCSEYHFELTPKAKDIVGDTVKTNGQTLDIIPGSPQNLKEEGTGDPSVILTWDPPIETAECADHYQVCARLQGETMTDCFNTTETKATLDKLQMCSYYFLTVSAVTSLGGVSDEVSVEMETPEGVPGQPQNLKVKKVGTNYITVTYNDPLINPLCVDEMSITGSVTDSINWEPLTVLTSKPNSHVCDPICEDSAIVQACSNIIVGVVGTNPSGIVGTPAFVNATTLDEVPSAPPSIDVQALSPTVIQVTWSGNPGDSCASSITICWIDEYVAEETCDDVIVGDGDGSGIYNITAALPCDWYEITVTVKSPTGLESVATVLSQATLDIEPSPVTDLRIDAVGTTDVIFSYNRSEVNPQCAANFEYIFTDLTGLHTLTDDSVSDIGAENKEVKTGEYKGDLLPCTDYLIQVITLSPTGLASAPQNVTVTTESVVSSPPQKFAATKIQTDTATLEWVKPKDNSRCVTEYKVTVSDSTTTEDYHIPVGKDAPIKSHYDLTGLSSCTNYDALITANSETGVSEAESILFKTLC